MKSKYIEEILIDSESKLIEFIEQLPSQNEETIYNFIYDKIFITRIDELEFSKLNKNEKRSHNRF